MATGEKSSKWQFLSIAAAVILLLAILLATKNTD